MSPLTSVRASVKIAKASDSPRGVRRDSWRAFLERVIILPSARATSTWLHFSDIRDERWWSHARALLIREEWTPRSLPGERTKRALSGEGTERALSGEGTNGAPFTPDGASAALPEAR